MRSWSSRDREDPTGAALRRALGRGLRPDRAPRAWVSPDPPAGEGAFRVEAGETRAAPVARAWARPTRPTRRTRAEWAPTRYAGSKRPRAQPRSRGAGTQD